jgi:GrpB-like predicted nucleotidyltransferase (UPF0157 family)
MSGPDTQSGVRICRCPCSARADECASGRLLVVPFPDEKFTQNVEVVQYRPEWATEGVEIAARLAQMIPGAKAPDHIGSTSVPGLPAKDCIDLMVRVGSLPDVDLSPLTQAGYRERPEEWNPVRGARDGHTSEASLRPAGRR